MSRLANSMALVIFGCGMGESLLENWIFISISSRQQEVSPAAVTAATVSPWFSDPVFKTS